jgi:hypothetical protein
MLSLAMALAAAGLPDETQCTALASESAAALAYATMKRTGSRPTSRWLPRSIRWPSIPIC